MYYFTSDVHLGAGTPAQSAERELKFIKWLDKISVDAREIYLVGDIFDFWFEYKEVVPKGFVRTLGRIAQLSEQGIRIVFIAGNHDMWVRDYFSKECGMEVYTTAQRIRIADKDILVSHGDNLNINKQPMLKLMNSMFRSPVVRYLFSAFIHPDLAIRFGKWWSSSSRKKHDAADAQPNRGAEVLYEYVRRNQEVNHFDCYIFGHMHIVAEQSVSGAHVMLMNDWSKNPYYIKIDERANASYHSVNEEIK